MLLLHGVLIVRSPGAGAGSSLWREAPHAPSPEPGALAGNPAQGPSLKRADGSLTSGLLPAQAHRVLARLGLRKCHSPRCEHASWAPRPLLRGVPAISHGTQGRG